MFYQPNNQWGAWFFQWRIAWRVVGSSYVLWVCVAKILFCTQLRWLVQSPWELLWSVIQLWSLVFGLLISCTLTIVWQGIYTYASIEVHICFCSCNLIRFSFAIVEPRGLVLSWRLRCFCCCLCPWSSGQSLELAEAFWVALDTGFLLLFLQLLRLSGRMSRTNSTTVLLWVSLCLEELNIHMAWFNMPWSSGYFWFYLKRVGILASASPC